MGSYRDEYIKLHTLELDVQWSSCSECEHVCDCQYYYGKCPKGLKPAGSGE